MYRCQKCNKDFDNVYQLNTHKGHYHSSKEKQQSRLSKLKQFGKVLSKKAEDNYNHNPKICIECGNCISYESYKQWRYIKFCTLNCSAKYNNRNRSYTPANDKRKKQSVCIKCNKSIEVYIWTGKNVLCEDCKIANKQNYGDIIMVCPICKKEFKVYKSLKRTYCSRKCFNADTQRKYRKTYNTGGCRRGSGRGKKGWYKGYWCDSSWELAWVIYQLDHKIKFKRNTQGFTYEFEGVQHNYYPDFQMDDESYVEIKGYMTEQNKCKLQQFKGTIRVVFKEDMTAILNYVTNNYGTDFIQLYEGNPHNERNNSCIICGKPAKNKCCSRICAGKYVKLNRKEAS